MGLSRAIIAVTLCLMLRTLALLLPFVLSACGATPPFGGTVYTEPNILVASDPSTLRSFSFVGMETTAQWDHRVEDEVRAEFYVFTAAYPSGQRVRFLVNGEYDTRAQARFAGQAYAFVLGQMPAILRGPVRAVTVHETGGDWSASPGEITIHDGSFEQEQADGALEESMIHETVHTSLDSTWEDTAAWKAAQRADGAFISQYAKSNPTSEDMAESFTLYLGYKLNPSRMSKSTLDTLFEVMPARMAFFEDHFPRSRLGL